MSTVSQFEILGPADQFTLAGLPDRTTACLIVDTNISVAWARAFASVVAPGVKALNPLVLTVTGFDEGVPNEIPEVRNLLDAALAEHTESKKHGALTCRGVANTIFPSSLWSPGVDRRQLYDRY